MTAFVPPPIAISSVIALSNASAVRSCEGRSPSCAIATARDPVSSAARVRSASTAGIEAVPGRDRPSASTIEVIVEAVPISLQLPYGVEAAASSSSNSA
jgi:hypothetical protein